MLLLRDALPWMVLLPLPLLVNDGRDAAAAAVTTGLGRQVVL